MRRMAKLRRLGSDPYIHNIYQTIATREAPVISAVKQLIIYPDNEKSISLNDQIREHLL